MKKLIVLVVLLALAAAGWWVARPSYRHFKERRFAAKAKAELANHDYRRALLTAHQVLALNSSNVTACEVMADLSDAASAPSAIQWRQRVAAVNPTMSNQMVLASCALRYEKPPFPIAASTLGRMAGKAEDYAPYHVVSAQLALKLNRAAEAEKHFEAAIRLEPTNLLHKLNLAVLHLESKDAAVSAAAQKEINEFEKSSEWGAQALRTLVIHHAGRNELDKAYECSARLLKQPRATFDDRLAHLAILHGLKKDEPFHAFAKEVCAQASTNAIMVAAVGRRLTALDDAVTALAWMKSLPPAIQNEPIVSATVANAYLSLKEWHALEQYLGTQGWKEQDFSRLALIALAIRQQKDEATWRVYWGRAATAAEDQPAKLGALAQMAGQWGWKKEMDDILWRVAQANPQERWAIESLRDQFSRERDSHSLLALYTLALDQDKTNAVAQNNVAALSMLLRTNLAQAHELAEKAYHAYPNQPAVISTYAWSLHLQGKTAEALKLMETIEPKILDDPSMACYYAALLAANGESQRAKAYIAKADGAKVFPEEKAMLEEARAKAGK